MFLSPNPLVNSKFKIAPNTCEVLARFSWKIGDILECVSRDVHAAYWGGNAAISPGDWTYIQKIGEEKSYRLSSPTSESFYKEVLCEKHFVDVCMSDFLPDIGRGYKCNRTWSNSNFGNIIKILSREEFLATGNKEKSSDVVGAYARDGHVSVYFHNISTGNHHDWPFSMGNRKSFTQDFICDKHFTMP